MKMDNNRGKCYNVMDSQDCQTLLNNVVVGTGKTMKSSKTAPQWAIDLVVQVCSDYKRSLPSKLQWFNRQPQYWGHLPVHSRGTTWRNGKIHISAGIDEYDQSLVLLHELAHHLVNRTRKGKREAHSNRFWKLAFELYDRYGLDLDYAWEREKDYKKKAAVGYQAILAKK